MIVVREPILKPVSIAKLRPTQITVGMKEVRDKQERLRKRPSKKIGRFLGDHMIPVILGPKNRFYVIDHHHLTRALHEEGIKDVLVAVVMDLSALETDSFWTVLDHRGWVHPYDAEGRRRDFHEIPTSIDDLKDDPFRSMAGELRRTGGFAKEATPFSEFLWADFLRRRMKRKFVEKHFRAAAGKALKMAKSKEAHYLPGWCGTEDE